MSSHKLIHQDSGEKDYYTPAAFTDMARAVMGSIDFDPASSDLANAGIAGKFGVGATEWVTMPDYTVIDTITTRGVALPVRRYGTSGHELHWHGNVWLNHPFGRDERPCVQECPKKICTQRGWHTATALAGNKTWVKTAVGNYLAGNCQQITMICFAAISSDWIRPLLYFPMLIPRRRVNYFAVENGEAFLKKGVTKDSVVFYLGRNVDRFVQYASKLGVVYQPARRY